MGFYWLRQSLSISLSSPLRLTFSSPLVWVCVVHGRLHLPRYVLKERSWSSALSCDWDIVPILHPYLLCEFLFVISFPSAFPHPGLLLLASTLKCFSVFNQSVRVLVRHSNRTILQTVAIHVVCQVHSAILQPSIRRPSQQNTVQ